MNHFCCLKMCAQVLWTNTSIYVVIEKVFYVINLSYCSNSNKMLFSWNGCHLISHQAAHVWIPVILSWLQEHTMHIQISDMPFINRPLPGWLSVWTLWPGFESSCDTMRSVCLTDRWYSHSHAQYTHTHTSPHMKQHTTTLNLALTLLPVLARNTQHTWRTKEWEVLFSPDWHA